MTIKQQGGIFGRNPTFNDVAVDGTLSTNELSVSGSFAVDDITIENNMVSSTGTLLLQAGDNLNIVTPLDGNSDNTLIVDAIGRTAFGISNTNLKLEAMGNDGATNRGSHYTLTAGGTSAWGGSELRFGYFSDGTDYGTRMTLTNGGNLSFPSGKGIDFSATSGTGTSELFSDYEEGSWSPVISDATSGGNTGTATVAYATYTKIGNLVHLKARLLNMNTTGMGSGNIYVQGVPYSADGDGEGIATMSYFTAAANSLGIVPSIDNGASHIKLKEVISGSVYINADSSQFNSGTADLWITITYNT